MNSSKFDECFMTAAECGPFLFQREFAEAPTLPQLVHVPTGLGKTAMAVIGWLWRRFGGDEELKATTPRRLVYCLPMRVLVEQTAENVPERIGHLRAASEGWVMRKALSQRQACILNLVPCAKVRCVDRDLATRNLDRSPNDFSFLLTEKFDALMFQIAAASFNAARLKLTLMY
jgi:hypothetical protein